MESKPPMARNGGGSGPVIGVLAIQGGFREHDAALSDAGARAKEVRRPAHLEGVQGLVIPGGESTTMSLVAEQWGLTEELRSFARSGKPVWGTCAGLILLADRAEGQKEGGQALVGGLDISVERNYFGAQDASFEAELASPGALMEEGEGDTFRAIFIRAPAVVQSGGSVQVLATLRPRGDPSRELAAAVKQGHLLGTAFHPELTADRRWHRLFARMCQSSDPYALQETRSDAPAEIDNGRPPHLPVFS